MMDSIKLALLLILAGAVGAAAQNFYTASGRSLTTVSGSNVLIQGTTQNLLIATSTKLLAVPNQSIHDMTLAACGTGPICEGQAQGAVTADIQSRTDTAMTALCAAATSQCTTILTTGNLYLKP